MGDHGLAWLLYHFTTFVYAWGMNVVVNPACADQEKEGRLEKLCFGHRPSWIKYTR